MEIKTLTRAEAKKWLINKTIVNGTAQTFFGTVTISCVDNMIVAVEFGVKDNAKKEPWAQSIIDNYFIRNKIDHICLLIGTVFQIAVWKSLAKIKRGQIITYGDLAKKSGYPKSARAIGNAMNKNPIPIFIPCHRVVAGGNKLGGYGGGLKIKKILLEKEGVLKNIKN